MKRLLVVGTLVLSGITSSSDLIACGDKGAGGGGSGGGGGGVVGTWVIDMDSAVPVGVEQAMASLQERIDAAPADQREMIKNLMPSREKLTEQVKAQLERTNAILEFKADKTFSAVTKSGTGATDTATGTWELSGETLTVITLMHNGAPAKGANQAPKSLTFSGDRLTMVPAPGVAPIGFRRK